MGYKKSFYGFLFFSKRFQAMSLQRGEADNTEQNRKETAIKECTVTQNKTVFRIAA